MKRDGILNTDGFNWSNIKLSDEDIQKLPKDQQADRRKRETETFAAYHRLLGTWVENHGGRIWNTIGDCTIADGFPSIDEAVAAAQAIQRRLTEFNTFDNPLGTALLVRIGVSRGFLPDIPVEKRGEDATPQLDEAGHLQKDCPPGRVRISRAVFDALRFGRQDFRPALTLDPKSKSKGSLVSVDRALSTQEIKVIETLGPRHRRAYPTIVMSPEDYLRMPYEHDFSLIPDILKEAFIILGETRPPETLKGPLSHPAATSDAVGMIEILASLQSSSKVVAGVDEWVDSVDLAAQTSIVVVGSPAVNLFAYAANTVTPAGFTQNRKVPMQIRVQDQGNQRLFPGDMEHSQFDRHFGLVLLTRNPINPKHHLLWIAGLSGIATQAAARFVRAIVLNHSETLSHLQTKNPNMAVVVPSWEHGYKIEEYQGLWRVNGYEVTWAGRQ